MRDAQIQEPNLPCFNIKGIRHFNYDEPKRRTVMAKRSLDLSRGREIFQHENYTKQTFGHFNQSDATVVALSEERFFTIGYIGHGMFKLIWKKLKNPRNAIFLITLEDVNFGETVKIAGRNLIVASALSELEGPYKYLSDYSEKFFYLRRGFNPRNISVYRKIVLGDLTAIPVRECFGHILAHKTRYPGERMVESIDKSFFPFYDDPPVLTEAQRTWLALGGIKSYMPLPPGSDHPPRHTQEEYDDRTRVLHEER